MDVFEHLDKLVVCDSAISVPIDCRNLFLYRGKMNGVIFILSATHRERLERAIQEVSNNDHSNEAV